jgi:hypothetical protein
MKGSCIGIGGRNHASGTDVPSSNLGCNIIFLEAPQAGGRVRIPDNYYFYFYFGRMKIAMGGAVARSAAKTHWFSNNIFAKTHNRTFNIAWSCSFAAVAGVAGSAHTGGVRTETQRRP